MPRYSEERKQTILSKMMPPLNMTIGEIARMEGIGEQTLYNWRNKAREQGRLGERRGGRMTSVSQRIQYVSWIRERNIAGARLRLVCDEVGISLRTHKRWYRGGKVTADKRPEAKRPAPVNKLSEHEQQVILDVCNESRFASFPPTQIVPTLLDDGFYYSSESTYYRVLKQHGQLNHRGRSIAPRILKAPQTFTASGPCQVFCWDTTYLPSHVRGQFFYLYMLEETYTAAKSLAGKSEPGELAAELLQRTLLREQCAHRPEWTLAGFKSLDEASRWVLKLTPTTSTSTVSSLRDARAAPHRPR